MRLRLRYRKVGKIRFTSHRDVARLWERAIRRTGLPVAYSEGFSPRPKLSFGLALSTGHESLAEYLDVVLNPRRTPIGPLADLPAALSAALPTGIDCDAAVPLPDGSPSLQEAVTSCSWEIHVAAADQAAVEAWVRRVLASTELVVTRERKGKPVIEDLRPSIYALTATGVTEWGPRIDAELGTRPRALRPTELLGAIEPRLEERLVRRTQQWIESEGRRHDPLEVAAPDAPRTPVCAS